MSTGGMAVQQATAAASDSALVRAARARDDDAFEELYRRYHAPVARFVRRYVRDDGRAEDVTQEAFVAALRRIRDTECEIRFRPWIYQIARNAAIDHHRRTSRTGEVSFDADHQLTASDNLRLTALSAPEASVIDKERLENLCGALDELSETHHRVIVMRELEGLSYREIGRRTGLSSAAVESVLFRARRRLKTEYEQLDSGRRCAAIRTLLARVAEGAASGRDRRRLDRHARRCRSCRRRARQLGVQPVAPRPAARRALALIPVPEFLRRWGPDARRPADASAREAALSPGVVDTSSQGVHKAAAVLASAIAVGGGGATLGGVGPLAVDPSPVTDQPATGSSAAPRERGTGPAPGHMRRERAGAGGLARGAGPAPGSRPGEYRSRDYGRGAGRPAENGAFPPSDFVLPASEAPRGAGPPISGLRAPPLPALPEPNVQSRPDTQPVPDLPASTDLSGQAGEPVGDEGGTVPDVGGTADDLRGTATDPVPRP